MAEKNHTTVREALGEQLKRAREKIRLTQAEVAASAGINVSYYAQIERGEVNPSFEKLYSISKALKIKSLNMSF
ncbi:MAG: hypothetical protein A2W80_10415 [Candidatus Riflebacteria bacterium GWC2_50_8]|nr:MAG: hypothetical protein A2W80_10415 [Candidatus Riflebacteria bacterium GWC2_50_8]